MPPIDQDFSPATVYCVVAPARVSQRTHYYLAMTDVERATSTRSEHHEARGLARVVEVAERGSSGHGCLG